MKLNLAKGSWHMAKGSWHIAKGSPMSQLQVGDEKYLWYIKKLIQ